MTIWGLSGMLLALWIIRAAPVSNAYIEEIRALVTKGLRNGWIQ